MQRLRSRSLMQQPRWIVELGPLALGDFWKRARPRLHVSVDWVSMGKGTCTATPRRRLLDAHGELFAIASRPSILLFPPSPNDCSAPSELLSCVPWLPRGGMHHQPQPPLATRIRQAAHAIRPSPAAERSIIEAAAAASDTRPETIRRGGANHDDGTSHPSHGCRQDDMDGRAAIHGRIN
jgi:hypothetical protein